MSHRAGFDFVRNDGTHIYTSVAAGEKLEIVLETAPPAVGIDLFTGRTINVHIARKHCPALGRSTGHSLGAALDKRILNRTSRPL
jgi:hypothetical protein